MSYVIYDIRTFKRLKDGVSYLTERAAKGVLTKATNVGDANKLHWIVASYDDWRKAEPMIETYNILDPEHKPIKIRASDKGTCNDPATERYHSM